MSLVQIKTQLVVTKLYSNLFGFLGGQSHLVCLFSHDINFILLTSDTKVMSGHRNNDA